VCWNNVYTKIFGLHIWVSVNLSSYFVVDLILLRYLTSENFSILLSEWNQIILYYSLALKWLFVIISLEHCVTSTILWLTMHCVVVSLWWIYRDLKSGLVLVIVDLFSLSFLLHICHCLLRYTLILSCLFLLSLFYFYLVNLTNKHMYGVGQKNWTIFECW